MKEEGDGFLRDTSCPSWLEKLQFAVPSLRFFFATFAASLCGLWVKNLSLFGSITTKNFNRKVRKELPRTPQRKPN